MPRIKVLHLITTLEYAGAQKVVFDLSRLINLADFEVSVVAISEHEEMLEAFEDNNIQTEILYTKKTISSVWNSYLRLCKIIKTQKIDIIHAHLTHANIIATFLKMRFSHLHLIFTPHSFNIGSKPRYLFVQMTKSLRSADIIFSKEMYQNSYKKDVVIIPNGIATKEYALSLNPFKTFTFICIGRLEAVKNQIALIEPVKRLKEAGYNFQLLLIGEGKERQAIEKAIQQDNLQSHIQLLGFRSDIPELCNQAHCLLIPSLWEGFPIALLEGGASALPIISVNVGSISTLLNTKTGYLINDIKEIGSKMAEVLDDYPSAKKKGNSLKQKIQKDLGIQSIVNQHESLYKKIKFVKKEVHLIY